MPEYKNLRIKDLALEDRPREKLLASGKNSLSNAELLAILLGSGNSSESALDVSRRILRSVDYDLFELSRMSVDQLKKINGIGPVKAITITAAFELCKRKTQSDRPEHVKIASSRDAYELICPLIAELSHEEFWILMMNRSNRCIRKQKISQGGLSGTVIDIRLILKYSLELLASSLIICHNHPSGNLNPSDADNRITKKIQEAARLMDIQLLDHIIVGDNSYFSYADNGLI
jgi:DNA repair protein RadC